MKKQCLAAILSAVLACVSSVPAMASPGTAPSPVMTETNETNTQVQQADSLLTADAALGENGGEDEEKASLTALKTETGQTVSGSESAASETVPSAESAGSEAAPVAESAPLSPNAGRRWLIL